MSTWRPSPRRSSRGSASLELIGIFPITLGVAVMVLQVGAVGYGAGAAQEAARAAARADSLGQDATTAARASLPSGFDLVTLSRYGGTSHGVRVTVRVPRVAPLPVFTLTREAELP